MSGSLNTHLLVPRRIHPALDRSYAPSKSFLVTEQLPKTHWVVLDLPLAPSPLDTEAFLDAAAAAADKDTSPIILQPAAAKTANALVIEVRGHFRDEKDIRAAAQRQVCILDQLVRGHYVEFGRELLAWMKEVAAAWAVREERVRYEEALAKAWPNNGIYIPATPSNKSRTSSRSSKRSKASQLSDSGFVSAGPSKSRKSRLSGSRSGGPGPSQPLQSPTRASGEAGPSNPSQKWSSVAGPSNVSQSSIGAAQPLSPAFRPSSSGFGGVSPSRTSHICWKPQSISRLSVLEPVGASQSRL
ncbi:hypothetical protein N7462_003119 [Penicillium macrosclerotiorum]|uniref:uncharacterized protein n=1 Tax=Penicillium macrosclerotiorum TaxID=303699 RepID=UPI00254828C1|nr:uncharacterized protein N7462_003119 [Penicillium macrosclerotiorum]KAJ5688727.1 hypothetical protein N7462_003119 [Penicillium macrosclerotiorum]